jgi:hypothetical protein
MDNVSVTERLAAIFSRAAILLKSSMNLDGVTFLDARQSDSQLLVLSLSSTETTPNAI